MLISYFNWADSGHSLDDFILILESSLATPINLELHENCYPLLTDSLGMPCQGVKDYMGTVVPVFRIEIGATLLETRIKLDKLQKARDATGNILYKESLTLQEAQSLTGFLSLCVQVVQTGLGLLRKFRDLVASHPVGSPRFSKRKFPSEVRADRQWWKDLLPVFKGVQFLTHNREKQCNCIQIPPCKASVAYTARTSHNSVPRPLPLSYKVTLLQSRSNYSFHKY